MTAPATRPRVRLLLACGGPEEYAQAYARRFAEAGAPIHTARLRPIGAEVQLVIELLDGRVMFSGLATVVAHMELGGPGYLLALVPDAEAPAASSAFHEYLFEELRAAAEVVEPVLEFWAVSGARRDLRRRSG